MPLIFIAILGLFIAFAVMGYVARQRRLKALRQWSQAKGLRFDSSRDSSFESQYPQFNCFDQGSNRYAFNCMSGTWSDRPAIFFDYHYETHSTDSKGNRTTTHHYFSGVIVQAGILLKPLLIRHENMLDKLAGFFGHGDIDFESAEFSKKFCVKSEDRKWAYDVLTPRTIEFLLSAPRFSIAFDTRHVLAWHHNRMDPSDFEQAAGVIEGVLNRLPDYLVQQQKALLGQAQVQ